MALLVFEDREADHAIGEQDGARRFTHALQAERLLVELCGLVGIRNGDRDMAQLTHFSLLHVRGNPPPRHSTGAHHSRMSAKLYSARVTRGRRGLDRSEIADLLYST